MYQSSLIASERFNIGDINRIIDYAW